MKWPTTDAEAEGLLGRRCAARMNGLDVDDCIVVGWSADDGTLLIWSAKAADQQKGHNGAPPGWRLSVGGCNLGHDYGHWFVNEGMPITWLPPESREPQEARWPHVCPDCGSPAYVGFTMVECSAAECRRSH